MKKTLLIIALGFFALGTTQAQEKGETRIHAFSTYGLVNHDFDFGGGVEYFFADQFALMPSYAKLFPEVGKLSNFSFDLRYYVTEGPSQLFFLVGYSQTFQNTQQGQAGSKQTFLGANVGIGAYIPLTEWLGLNTEFRAQTQYRQEAGFRLGLVFPL
jgi:hypothetical protein